MPNSINIFRHALRQVTGNLSMAIKVSALVFGVYAIISLWLLLSGVNSDPAMASKYGMAVLGLIVLQLWAWSLIAVVWHRFILLEEYPASWFPYKSDLRIWGYALQGLKIALILFLPLFVVLMVLALVLNLSPESLQSPIIVIVASTVLMTGFFRLSITLPHVALNKSDAISLRDAWQMTADLNGPIFGLAGMIVVLNVLPGIVTSQFSLSGAGLVFLLVVLLAVEWFMMMLSVSVLTTIYGHVIQNRPVE